MNAVIPRRVDVRIRPTRIASSWEAWADVLPAASLGRGDTDGRRGLGDEYPGPSSTAVSRYSGAAPAQRAPPRHSAAVRLSRSDRRVARATPIASRQQRGTAAGDAEPPSGRTSARVRREDQIARERELEPTRGNVPHEGDCQGRGLSSVSIAAHPAGNPPIRSWRVLGSWPQNESACPLIVTLKSIRRDRLEPRPH